MIQHDQGVLRDLVSDLLAAAVSCRNRLWNNFLHQATDEATDVVALR